MHGPGASTLSEFQLGLVSTASDLALPAREARRPAISRPLMSTPTSMAASPAIIGGFVLSLASKENQRDITPSLSDIADEIHAKHEDAGA